MFGASGSYLPSYDDDARVHRGAGQRPEAGLGGWAGRLGWG